MPPAWLTGGYLNAALTLIVKADGAFRGRHSMNFLDLARAIFGLAFTLGLIGLAAWAARR